MYKEFAKAGKVQMAERGFTLVNQKPSLIKKKRCATDARGKSSGYRLICMVHEERAFCLFIMIYPKFGPCKKDSASKKEWQTALNKALEDKKNGKLLRLRFKDDKKKVHFEVNK